MTPEQRKILDEIGKSIANVKAYGLFEFTIEDYEKRFKELLESSYYKPFEVTCTSTKEDIEQGRFLVTVLCNYPTLEYIDDLEKCGIPYEFVKRENESQDQKTY